MMRADLLDVAKEHAVSLAETDVLMMQSVMAPWYRATDEAEIVRASFQWVHVWSSSAVIEPDAAERQAVIDAYRVAFAALTATK